jgi:tRNA pseudouridine38-40 synthase
VTTARLRIDLAYDGEPWSGFARQRDRLTVQGTLEGALTRITGQPVSTVCAGRTDRGVHAIAQVVHVDIDRAHPRVAKATRDLDVLRFRLDRMVGDAITIWQVREVGAGFDARFSATERGYRYRLVDGETIDPVRRHDRWHIGEPLDVPAMRAGAKRLLGQHDYAAFCRNRQRKTTVRRLDVLTLTRPRPGTIHVRLAGPAFCHQMVRAIVGCLVEVGLGKEDPAWIGEVLAARDRSLAARVAPAHGLTLERVSYGRRYPTAPPPAGRRACGS